ncbi:MAG: hypothetical protein GY765_23230 [bacterium]|nr:hypothetical protein [bacterium]
MTKKKMTVLTLNEKENASGGRTNCSTPCAEGCVQMGGGSLKSGGCTRFLQ